MKRLLAILLAAVLILTACGKGSNTGDGGTAVTGEGTVTGTADNGGAAGQTTGRITPAQRITAETLRLRYLRAN